MVGFRGVEGASRSTMLGSDIRGFLGLEGPSAGISGLSVPVGYIRVGVEN